MQKTHEARKKPDLTPPAADFIGLISGLYTPPLWDALRIRISAPEALCKMLAAVAALHDGGNTVAAFDLVTALYETAGLDVPEAIASLKEHPDNAVLFLGAFIADSRNILFY